MVPPKPTPAYDSSFERTEEYNEFIAKLTAYHEKRGTTDKFDPEARVGGKPFDLLRLFEEVNQRGGYDRVSDEKLAWRKLAAEFNLGPANMLPGLGFQLKSAYYRNLAAFEISTVHGKEPPPRDILEDRTAKGGGLLTRTKENFNTSTRGNTAVVGTENSEVSGDDGTPVRDPNAGEETPGSGCRATRGLRQAPPQRVIFQPDTQPSKQTRPISATSNMYSQHHHQPQQSQQPRGASAIYHPPSNGENSSPLVLSYETKPQTPLNLRPVSTPATNPRDFTRRQRLSREAAAATTGAGQSKVPPGLMLPGTGHDGPNIYVRCLCALKSGIPAEQDYALHHLVKISMERGDKYRFESFPGLAEALIEKALEVGSLFYKVKWEVCYTEDQMAAHSDTLDGAEGTPDILERIRRVEKLDFDDNIQTPEFRDALTLVNEAALTLRNMILLEENAQYTSELAPLRDFLSIALNLPSYDCTVELKHYALDIAEQITKYLSFDATDPLYTTLLAQLQSSDRGAILTSLRAICRISMNLEENNALKGIPLTALENIMDWILLDDEDLVLACLDFLYQYTAVVGNVNFLITHAQTHTQPLVDQLTRLLMYGVKIIDREYTIGTDGKKPAPKAPPPVPEELMEELLQLQEPERSSQWLRSIFEEDRDEHITQIALWQAYQARFTIPGNNSLAPLLQAADFIKNVSTTFSEKAAAQVQAGPVQKFIMKGIRFRSVAVDSKGEEYKQCLWRPFQGQSNICDVYFMDPEKMYSHILIDHIGASRREDGKFINTSGEYICRWDLCQKYKEIPATKLIELGRHVKLHLPRPLKPTPENSGTPTRRQKPSYIIPARKQVFMCYYTPTGDAAGIPINASLVLRNIARNISKSEAEDINLKAGGISWVDRLLKAVEPRYADIFAHMKNEQMVENLIDLISAIKDSPSAAAYADAAALF